MSERAPTAEETIVVTDLTEAEQVIYVQRFAETHYRDEAFYYGGVEREPENQFDRAQRIMRQILAAREPERAGEGETSQYTIEATDEERSAYDFIFRCLEHRDLIRAVLHMTPDEQGRIVAGEKREETISRWAFDVQRKCVESIDADRTALREKLRIAENGMRVALALFKENGPHSAWDQIERTLASLTQSAALDAQATITGGEKR